MFSEVFQDIFGKKEPLDWIQLRDGSLIPDNLLDMVRDEVIELKLIEEFDPQKLALIAQAAMANPQTLKQCEDYFRLWLAPQEDLSDIEVEDVMFLAQYLIPWHRASLSRDNGVWRVICPVPGQSLDDFLGE